MSSDQCKLVLDQYATKLLKQFETKKQSMSEFRDRLTELVESINNINNNDFPMYILIDELDRCRPTYAIALLERIKHLFSAENVVFLIATDTNQLQHAISAVYGVGFDGARYLQRFFDRTYLFERPNIESFVRKLFHRYQVDSSQLSATVGDAEEYFNKMMSYCELSLRDIERCFDILRGSITLWDQETPLELIYLLPLIIKHSTRDDEGFRRLAELDTSYLRGSIFDNKHAYEVIVEVNGGGTRKTVMNSMLVGEVISRLKKPLMDALDSKYSSVFDIFQREFQVIQNLRLNPQNPPGQSVLLTYPLLVRGSARFSDPAL